MGAKRMNGYFDNASTTAVAPQVVEAMQPYWQQTYGNPSSLHHMGFLAERAVETARGELAALLGCEKSCLFFTSGGTEANNTALFGAARARRRRGNRIVTTAIEHASVLESAEELERRGYEVVFLQPDRTGSVTAEQLAAAVDDKTLLVSCMLVNNETGAVQPILEAAPEIRRKNPDTLIHCDAVQALGKLPLQLRRGAVDLASVTAHKLYGPKGVGALYVAKGVHIAPLLYGGEQQRGVRPGTESVPLIVGFGRACALAREEMARDRAQVRRLAQLLRAGVAGVPGCVLNSPPDALEYIVNLSVEGVRSEILLHYLEERGLFVSSGSACAKGKPSHVLAAMDVGRLRADSALRVSFSRDNREEDVERLLEALRAGAERLAKR